MPASTDIERRDRAIVAFTLLTGARDRAIVSAKLKHVDLIACSFFQDAREVRTKFSKTFTTFFFPVGDEIRNIVAEWLTYLRQDRLYGNDDPLFPKTRMTMGETKRFEHVELSREHWANATPVRSIFRSAFEAAGLPYFNPHSLRNTLALLGQRLCLTPEQLKAWSQNLGHEAVLTTFASYGTVADSRQGEVIRALGLPKLSAESASMERLPMELLLKEIARRVPAIG